MTEPTCAECANYAWPNEGLIDEDGDLLVGCADGRFLKLHDPLTGGVIHSETLPTDRACADFIQQPAAAKSRGRQ